MHTLLKLPYAYDALEPYIDADTMKIHHSKHHQSYVDKLNAALEAHSDLQSKSIVDLISDLESVPESIRTKVRNNGGGDANHRLFFTLIAPGGGDHPQGMLSKALDDNFGGFDAFKDAFAEAATGQFGSGWAWLSLARDGELTIEGTPNQDSPLMSGRTPVLGLDVWEHAYYLKYQNRRAEYVDAFWNVVNWDNVANNYEALVRHGATA